MCPPANRLQHVPFKAVAIIAALGALCGPASAFCPSQDQRAAYNVVNDDGSISNVDFPQPDVVRIKETGTGGSDRTETIESYQGLVQLKNHLDGVYRRTFTPSVPLAESLPKGPGDETSYTVTMSEERLDGNESSAVAFTLSETIRFVDEAFIVIDTCYYRGWNVVKTTRAKSDLRDVVIVTSGQYIPGLMILGDTVIETEVSDAESTRVEGGTLRFEKVYD
jgi:hypothetical protein